MATVGYTDLTLLKRVLAQARPYSGHLAAIYLLGLASTVLALLLPLPLKIAVDSGIGAKPLPPVLGALLPEAVTGSGAAVITVAAALLVTIGLLTQLQSLANSVLCTYTGEKLVLAFRAQLFRHVQRLSLAYHDSQGTTHSTYRIQYDAPCIQWIAVDILVPLVTAACTLAAMILIMARVDWQLALVALAVAPVLFLLSRRYSQRLRSDWHEVKKLENSALSIVAEALAALRVVKACGQEDREQERFVRRASDGFLARIRAVFIEGRFVFLVGLITALGSAAVLFLSLEHVRQGLLTLGDALLVMGYLAQFYAPLQTMSKGATSLQASLASAERALALLDEEAEVAEQPRAKPITRARGAVAFRHLSFAYGPDRPVLSDISFEVESGTRVGIVGTTGAGKTTLVSLLMRFYDPTTGQILLDGVDLRDYRLADLRNQFALVLQEPVLFSTCIAENIAYARPGATEEEVMAAARAANAHDFISRLPHGYQTQVGERGMQLSGGERQRIALARAFLKDAPLLILDEPTSSVDVRTEATILDAMRRLMKGRTTFIIAHRLNTLEGCHIRLHIEQGRLVRVTEFSRDPVPSSGLSFGETTSPVRGATQELLEGNYEGTRG
jgi:ATP-binding cassette subfamily B protein